MTRERVLSVTLADCDVQTFRGSGAGGQNRNKRDTGVRIIHRASGARGESCEERSQLQNKRTAFTRMANTKEFRDWVRDVAGDQGALLAAVERDMWPVNLKTEVRENGKWVQA